MKIKFESLESLSSGILREWMKVILNLRPIKNGSFVLGLIYFKFMVSWLTNQFKLSVLLLGRVWMAYPFFWNSIFEFTWGTAVAPLVIKEPMVQVPSNVSVLLLVRMSGLLSTVCWSWLHAKPNVRMIIIRNCFIVLREFVRHLHLTVADLPCGVLKLKSVYKYKCVYKDSKVFNTTSAP